MKALAPFLLAGALTLAVPTSFSQAPAASDNQPAPLVLLVPIEISNKALESGCWAQFYDERNFKGDMLTVVGPREHRQPGQGKRPPVQKKHRQPGARSQGDAEDLRASAVQG